MPEDVADNLKQIKPDSPMPTSTRTTCPYCGVGCGVVATRHDDGRVTVTGDPDHPANFGRLCSKGSALGETLGLDDRILMPEMDGEPTSWDAALTRVADGFRQTIERYGPDSVALYVSGQFLTEDYYVANKLMKGFIGSANIDTNSRLCMSSSVAGHRRAFGADTVPGLYRDLETADLVVLVGSNLAWCHPVLFQRLQAAREARGTRIVVIDPRETDTCAIADLHLALAPESDIDLFAGLLAHLAREECVDWDYVARHTSGLEACLDAVAGLTIAGVAAACGLSKRDVRSLFYLFAGTERVVTVYSQGVNQSVRGTDKVNAIINCHLATGRIGREGMGPFSVTGQPNAMGGREVGGLSNMLAAHMSIDSSEDRERVQRFWSSPAMATRPGLKAVDLFRAVSEGRVKAIWIMATNPVVSLPEADLVKAALAVCDLVVVSDVVRTDTTVFADVLLPAAAWGEKSGTVTNSERRISRQRAFLDRPGDTRPDWAVLADVARRMGFVGFDYSSPADVFREHAALSAFENDGSRDFDIGAKADLCENGFEAMTPFQWPHPAGKPETETRFFADGGFFTPDRRARLIPTPPGSSKATTSRHPFVLNSGRIRDQWHTMTRTARSARLMSHAGEPYCEIAPADATRLGVGDAGLVEISNHRGRVLLRALVSRRQRPGSVFVPIHWSEQFASAARVGVLVDPDTDAVSGQPGSKFAAVSVRPFMAAWYGYLVTTQRPAPVSADYWASARCTGGWRTELAALEDPDDWDAYARSMVTSARALEWVAYHDRSGGIARLAAIVDGRLVAALFVSREPVAVARELVAAQLDTVLTARERLALLAGRAGADRPDPGVTVCACHSIGSNQILAALRSGAASTVDGIGACLKAGTHCGSCRAEIGRMILREPAIAAE